jgi:hypothetical protein
VQKCFRKPEFEGMLGTIKNCYGDPGYPVLDVQLEDGRLELFWIHQLEKAEVDFATRSLRSYGGS